MENVANTIEDLLEILAGLRDQAKIQVKPSDATIMHSVARQVFRGTPLTDRQYALMKEKLQDYKSDFTSLEYDFDRAIDGLRSPLRSIDRSKYVKIVDYPDDIPYEDEDNLKFIAVRFPFKKSDIMLINEISHKAHGYYHKKGSHVHYFLLTEKNLLNIGDRFFHKEFEIDTLLTEKYNKIKKIKDNPSEYLPFVKDGKILNIKDSLATIIEEETEYDLLKVYDRRFRYCLEHINIKIDNDSLESKIVNRSSVAYHSKPSVETVDQVLHALYNLDRFPMLVLLESAKAEVQLYEVANFFRDLIPSNEQSVLFRDEESDSGFNQLIKHRNLNNWVDKNTKIVYINNNKLPKVLFETDWKPVCTFAYNSNNNKHVQMYSKNHSDLIVHREETISPFMRMYF
jgi:hypothetical protein